MFENATVLVFEDDEIAYKLIETVLHFFNVEVLHAETGKEGIELFKNNRVALVLLDLHLPDIDGFELLDALIELKANVPIVAQTAYAINNEKQRCLEKGCVDFLLKPLNVKKLQKIADEYLK